MSLLRLISVISGSPISRAIVDQYRRDGFVVLRKVVGRDTVVALRAAFDQVLASAVGSPAYKLMGGMNPHINRPSHLHEIFGANEAIEEAKIRAAVLMGIPHAQMCWDMLIYKGPGSTAETPWHQDHAYAASGTSAADIVPNPLSSVQMWIPLDDVDEENGCMRFVPGQHLKPMLEHEYVPAGKSLRIKDERLVLDLAKAVSCPLRAGDATAHGPNTPHFTPGNQSKNRRRRAYILTFAPAGV